MLSYCGKGLHHLQKTQTSNGGETNLNYDLRNNFLLKSLIKLDLLMT